MKITVNVPSCRRPKVETLKYIPFARVYVDHKEYDDYSRENPGAEIIPCEEGIQGNLCRIRNHIIRTEFEAGVECVIIVDDDLQHLARFSDKVKRIYKPEEIMPLFQKCAILALDMGVFFWGVNCNKDPQSYREYTPFSTVSYIGGPFQAFMQGNTLFYDERLSLKEDYDMTLQQLNRYRCVLRFNYLSYTVRQSEQPGGCAVYRNYEEEERQLNLLVKKWGPDIVKKDKADRSHKSKKRRKRLDYNPVIRVPILGV